jgi:predicted RNase H-like nuclease (RuvC/YqgF family)
MEWKPRGNPNFAKLRNSETPDRRELAAAAHVSPRTIDDAKVAVNGGLGKQVRDGKITASAAAEKVRQQHRPERTPKESPLDKARAEIAELREKLAAALDHIKELTDELQSAADAGSDDKQQKLKFAQLRQNIRALESQRDENMRLLTECKREIKALRKALGRD